MTASEFSSTGTRATTREPSEPTMLAAVCWTGVPVVTRMREAVPEIIDTLMRRPSFSEWLEHRPDEAPAAEKLATLIASAGAAGISLDRLRILVRLSPETLQDILKSLVATGQVVVMKIGGEMRYRVAG